MSRYRALVWAAATLAVATSCLVPEDASAADASPHKIRFVTVQHGVRLEVLDWGGSGPPLIFLAGLGATAHDFDAFAPRFMHRHHVYGITRRGFGASDKPRPTIANYSADRLGNDVLAAMDALHVVRPVLVGHSIAGGELSSIATRYPQKIAGLIYLEAAYAYAFYTPTIMPLYLKLDIDEMRTRVDRLGDSHLPPASARREVDNLLNANAAQLRSDLLLARRFLTSPSRARETQDLFADPAEAILAGVKKFGGTKVRTLAVYALPDKRQPPQPPAASGADIVAQAAIKNHVADLFARANPHAKVIRIPNAEHDVFNSNPGDVLREMNAFLDGPTR